MTKENRQELLREAEEFIKSKRKENLSPEFLENLQKAILDPEKPIGKLTKEMKFGKNSKMSSTWSFRGEKRKKK